MNLAGLCGVNAAETLPDEADVPEPQLQLPQRTHGQAAIDALGKDLPRVAAFYRTTEKELKERLGRDKTLWVDEKGRLLYVCTWQKTDGTEPTAEPQVSAAAPFPEENTFKLHSRPGANRVIYLDFDGCNASSTSWGADAIGRAFDTDSNPSSFSSSERTIIQGVWQRVAEDYAMYDVDVTTEDPGTEALKKSSTSDTTYGIRVAIGGSSSDWYGSGAGGVAYVGSFNWSSDTPCWIFPGSLGNSEKNIAEAASHEVGHTLGLSHDGQDVGSTHTEYYAGQGNWAPIMGVGYNEPITQWSKGEYANANNTEDDLAKMPTYGVSYRTDDYGSSLAAPTMLQGVSFSIPGNVERTTDVDYFKFQTGAGLVTLKAQPAPKGPNLHIQMSLMNAAGIVISTANPADTTAGVQPATISTLLSAGTYYVSVQGVGSGDPLTTGYSDYGSLGQYTLTGSLPSDSSWAATSAGTDYLWTATANWSGSTFPYGAGGVARLVNNIAGDQTISLDTPQVLGGLIIGDADSLNSFTVQNGTSGSLAFSSQSGEAWLSKFTGANDTIAATLTLNSPLSVTNSSAADLRLTGPIYGTGSIRKSGIGNLVLEGTNSATGNIVIGQGKLTLGSMASIAAPTVDIRAGAELNTQALGTGLVLNVGQTLTGMGAVVGGLALENGAILAPGSNSVAGTLSVTGAVNMAAGARLRIDLGPSTTVGSGSNDLLVVNGDLNLTGPVVVEFVFPGGLPSSPGTYTLASYTGAFTGGTANLQAATNGDRYTYVFDSSVAGEIRVHVSGAPVDLVWQGDGTANSWDVAATTNWNAAGTPAQFQQLDRVVFNDAGSNSPSISLTAAVEPGSMTVESSKDYTIGGTGKLGGKTSVLKSGAGTLTLGTANTFTGAIAITGGKLKAGNASALGSADAGTTVSGGGTLDLYGYDLGAEPLTISGSGVGGIGALYNGWSSARTNATRSITLSGDATIGGIGRWDLRGTTGATLAGNHFNLTKTGANEIWLADAGASGLGNISIVQGTLGFEGSTTLGDTTARMTVYTNGTLAVSETMDNTLVKDLVLNGGRINSIAGFNSFSGAVTLIGSNNITASSSLALRGAISGNGSVNISGTGTVMLTAANTYTGETRVTGGALEVYNASALGSTAAGTIIGSGARLDVRGVNLGAEPITVQGTGLGNAGAIVNTGAAQNNALSFVTLSGATTFGGINRWDIRANPTGSLAGNSYALTKRGPNEVWLVDLGATGLGAITVAEGLLGVQGTTTLGNSASTLTVNSAASVGIYATGTNTLVKSMALSSGRVYNASGLNTFAGTTTLTGSNRFEIASGTKLTMSGTLSGAGALYKLGTGTLILTGNNTITGLKQVAAGTLQVGDGGSTGSTGSGNITNSGTLIFFRNNALPVSNPISGTGSLQMGVIDSLNTWVGGTIILSGANTYSGNTVVYGNGNLLGVGNDYCLGAGTLTLSGNNNGNSVAGIRAGSSSLRTITNLVQLGACNKFQFGSSGTGDLVFNGPRMITDTADKTLMVSNNVTTINSEIGGNSRLIKTGPGTLALGGNNTNGAMVIEMGTVRVDAETRLGRNPVAFISGQLSLNGGTLQATASFAIDDNNRGVTLMAAGGTFQVDSGCTLTLTRSVSGAGGLRKTGLGTLQLSAVNSYAGGTTNLEGTMILNGEIKGGGLDISGGTLTGGGRCTGPVVIQPAGTLSPGVSIGTMTCSNTLDLAGTTIMEVNAAQGTSDLVTGMSTVRFGGTLRVQNTGGTFSGSAAFKLFNAATYQGEFKTLDLPQLPQGFFWDQSTLATDGTLRITESKPAFASPELQGNSLVLSGTGGAPGAEFVLRTSTNAANPILYWPIVSTNTFDASGSFSLTNAIDPAIQQMFYLIQTSGW